MSTHVLNRRSLLKAGAAGLGYLFTGPAFSVARAAGSNDRLKVAGIGVGGKGSSDIDQAGELMEVVALCDIDDHRLGDKAKKWPHAKTFADFRELLADPELARNVDAVTVSTPDHTHALAAVMAMRAGKHVYCQKPLTRTVFEARLMRETAAKYAVCTQMGNQGTAENGLRRAAELIRDGALGRVTEVHVWTNRPVWPQAPIVTRRPDPMPAPGHVHWDEFVGPAPMRPYAEYPRDNKALSRFGPGAYHAFNWRGWWDFGTGAIGDMACHTANLAYMGLDLGLPTRVSAEATDVNPETCPSSAHVVMQFPARGGRPAVTLHWYEGQVNGNKLVPPRDLLDKVLAKDEQLVNSGSLVVGDKGILYSPNDYGAKFRVTPAGLLDGVPTDNPQVLPANGRGDLGQKAEWVDAIKAGKPDLALANFAYGSKLTEAFLLGNCAIRSGKAFTYDPDAGRITDSPEAAAYLHYEYRKGWDMLGDKA